MLGPSGCGKTTLLRLIAGLEKVDSGSILFDQQDVSPLPIQKRGIGIVFQTYALWPHMTVDQNLRFGLKIQGFTKAEQNARIEETLALVGLNTLSARFPHELSGGQQQRVALARALALKPKILLLDEPLSNLDAKLRAKLRDDIRALHEALKITMVYVTHDREEALSMADSIAVMNEGRVLQVGAAPEIYERPQSLFVADFLGEVNSVEGVTKKRGEHSALVDPYGFTLDLSDGYTESRKGSAIIRPEKLRIGGALQSEEKVSMLQGVVRQITYLGGSERIEVEVVTKRRFIIHRIADPSSVLHLGEPVQVRYHVRDVTFLNAHG